jgi:hypothetical protein
VNRTGSQTFVDPGIFAVARGAALRFNVRKPGFAAPIRFTRVIRGPGGTVREVPLPASLIAGFQGLRNFVVVTVRNSAGKIVATRHLTFCPNVFDPQRAGPGSPPGTLLGFRSGTGPVMHAFQYFFLHGKVIGRAPAGTMLFDSSPDEQEWHFQQFAQYRLLDASKTTAVLSHKEAFCLAPTAAYDLLHPGAAWQPEAFGLGEGNCGLATALWTHERLPLGWADTYTQSLDGQNFNVTHLPNGTYYIEVIANPERVLHETNMANDVSLRKIILGGTPDHRTLRVPPFTA